MALQEMAIGSIFAFAAILAYVAVKCRALTSEQSMRQKIHNDFLPLKLAVVSWRRSMECPSTRTGCGYKITRFKEMNMPQIARDYGETGIEGDVRARSRIAGAVAGHKYVTESSSSQR